jgi:hypothetical protein
VTLKLVLDGRVEKQIAFVAWPNASFDLERLWVEKRKGKSEISAAKEC